MPVSLKKSNSPTAGSKMDWSLRTIPFFKKQHSKPEDITKTFIMKENIFHGFLNFFDCQFEDTVHFSNNILLEGCNLLGNKGEGYETIFDNGIIQDGNIGRLDLE